ncbi:MAG TPA: thioesterase domain-containing protein [Burkholderiales bacterium]
MSVAAFLSELRRRDIVVWLDGAELRCNAPAGALQPELRELLRQRKNDILEFLRSAKAAASQARGVVPLQQNGGRTPVFAVPGHNGDVFCYRALAQSLGDDQPFFGLQPPGLDGAVQPLTRVEALAEYLAGQVRAFHAEGPCIIAGFCAGGAVAFELARQLRSAGTAVPLLALFGSPYPAFFRLPGQLRYRIGLRIARLREHAHALTRGSWAQRSRYLQDRLAQRKNQREERRAAHEDPVIRLRLKVEHATVAALRDYEPGRFEGRMALLLPCRSWTRGSWRGLDWKTHAQLVETYYGPEGADGDNMLRAQYAPAFAELFKRARLDAKL